MAASQPSARRRGESEWREIIERCDSSGLSARAFCEREGLSLSSFQRWRPRCRARVGAQFVELPASASSVEKSSGSGSDWSVELELPGGLCLRLRG